MPWDGVGLWELILARGGQRWTFPGFIPEGVHVAEGRSFTLPTCCSGGIQDVVPQLSLGCHGVVGTVTVKRARSRLGYLLGLGHGSLGHPHFSWGSGGPQQVWRPPNTFTLSSSSLASASQHCRGTKELL